MFSLRGLRAGKGIARCIAYGCCRMALPTIAAVLICTGTQAHADVITIDPTFASGFTTDEENAVDAAISAIESQITSPNALTVSIYFYQMSGGLGESTTTVYDVSYYDYYNAFKAVATSPAQLSALASLGAAPANSGAGNPVNGNTLVEITSAEGRNLGFNTPGEVPVSSSTYDSKIGLNTNITSPPNSLSGYYGLQSTANHEIDEVLGIGGTGSTLNGSGSLTGAVGDLDLFRYTCSAAQPQSGPALTTCPSGDASRSYSNLQSTTPYSYFSVDGGATVVSYFNQTSGADFADWLSDPVPSGFMAQVQDAFGGQGTDPALGVNEITAFNAIGYQVVAPEPSSLMLTFAGLGLVLGYSLVRRIRTAD
jgi:hypothetical protein